MSERSELRPEKNFHSRTKKKSLMKLSTKIILIGILLLAACFRLYNFDWDLGYHLHPDERAIVMTVDKLSLPNNLSNFFSPVSPWNPHFFAYGSFPFYILYFLGNLLS